MPKIGKSGDIPVFQREKAQEIFKKTLRELNLSEEENKVYLINTDGSSTQLPIFEAKQGEEGLAYSITYLTPQGGRLTYKKGGSRWETPYKRSRLIQTTSSGQKYTQDKGTKAYPFLTAIYKFYWSQGIDTPQVVITEGEKKAYALCASGIPAIAVPGIWGWGKKKVHRITGRKIGVTINPVLDEALLSHGLRQITFLFDADQRSPKKNLTFYRACHHFLLAVKHLDLKVRIGFQEPLTISKEEPKGIDDLIHLARRSKVDLRASIENAIERSLVAGEVTKYFHIEKLHLFRKENDLKHVLRGVAEYLNIYTVPLNPEVNSKKIPVKRYVSEGAEALYSLMKANSRLVVQAPTGSGKTAGVLGELIPSFILPNNPQAFCVFLVPTLSILDNITTGGAKELVPFERVDGTTPREIITRINNPQEGVNVVVSTYDGLSKIARPIDWLFIDEAHRITSDNTFRSKALVGIEKVIFGSFRHPNTNTVLMSAQPSLYFEEFGFTYAEVVPEEVKRKDVKVEVFSTKVSLVLENLIKRIASTEGKYAIRLQSKARIEDLKEALVRSGLKESEVLIVTSKNREDEARRELLSSEVLPDEVRVLLCTSILDEGVNINNTTFEGVYFFADKISGVLCSTSAKQFLNRFRKIDLNSSCDFTVFLRGDKRTGSNCFLPKDTLQDKLEFARLNAKSYSSPGALGSSEAPELYGSQENTGDAPIVYFDEVDLDYKPYALGVIQETETYYNRKRNATQFIEELKEDRTLKVRTTLSRDIIDNNLLIDEVEAQRKLKEDSMYKLILVALSIMPRAVFSLFESRLKADKRNPLLVTLNGIFSSTYAQYNQLPFSLPSLNAMSGNVKQKVEHKLTRIMELFYLGYSLEESVKFTIGLTVLKAGSLSDFLKFNAIYNKLTRYHKKEDQHKAVKNINAKDLAKSEAYNKVRLRLAYLFSNNRLNDLSRFELLYLIRENTVNAPTQKRDLSILKDNEVLNAVKWFTSIQKKRTKAGYKYSVIAVYSVKASADRWKQELVQAYQQYSQSAEEVSEGALLHRKISLTAMLSRS